MGASWPDVGEFMKDECDDQCKDEHFGPTYTINRETKKDLGAAIAKPLVCKLRSTLSSSDEEQHPQQSKQQSDETILAEAMLATPLAAKHQALTKNVKAAALRLKGGGEPKAKALGGPKAKAASRSGPVKMEKKYVHSRAWHAAFEAAKRRGMSHSDSKTLARETAKKVMESMFG